MGPSAGVVNKSSCSGSAVAVAAATATLLYLQHVLDAGADVVVHVIGGVYCIIAAAAEQTCSTRCDAHRGPAAFAPRMSPSGLSGVHVGGFVGVGQDRQAYLYILGSMCIRPEICSTPQYMHTPKIYADGEAKGAGQRCSFSGRRR